jgi:DNA-directed RNA polymerase specialized sigma24 family protein
MRAGVADSKWDVETTTRSAVWWPALGDERLARLAARGSQRAFAAVYERHHQALYRYCRSILRDDTDAQDALQSTFTRALSAIKRGQRSAPLRPWLFRIAHN